MGIDVAASRLRVLVVDDDQDAADSLVLLIRLWGHDVRPAYDGRAALEIARDFQPDLMVVDIAMPGMDGNELARTVHCEPTSFAPKLIACTGYADERHRRLSKEAGFDGYLVKPMELDPLQRLLETLVRSIAIAERGKELAGRGADNAGKNLARAARSRPVLNAV